ncbi:SOS response-associated peptidase [Actinotalea sp. K2]|uniref:SOS response-associated peptidase n=1 Tax=Actinotalea sp. K2 TaxID=2939438 RepID=UPI00201708AF|nr:SOS response-associated peptidase [Actinotalea sp. K2]MCL3862434.1 SOS response-associated peptidase [Actinotalea sp. K2]
MCGRYASFREAQDLADAFRVAPQDVDDDVLDLPAAWNVAPTDPVRIVVERESHHDPDAPAPVRSLRLARWGLVPGWAKDPSVGARMINARRETLAQKPAFRGAVATRRCLVPADGYYEWQPPPPGSPARSPKQPFWIHRPDGAPLALAGLYAFWRDPSRPDDDPLRWVVSTTVVTGAAPTGQPEIAAIHDRTPVVVPPERWDAWLDPALQDPTQAVALLDAPNPELLAERVPTLVNRVGTDGPELIRPI